MKLFHAWMTVRLSYSEWKGSDIIGKWCELTILVPAKAAPVIRALWALSGKGSYSTVAAQQQCACPAPRSCLVQKQLGIMQHSTYLFVFSIRGPGMVCGLFSKYAVVCMFKSQKIRIPYHSIMLYSFFIDDNCRCHFFALIALFETADLDFCMNDTWIAYKHL